MEEFRDIPWYEWLYQVSNLWNVISLNFNRTWESKKLKNTINKKWYVNVWLKNKSYRVHRLVAQAFLWLDIDNKHILICHKNDIKIDNRVDNLFLWTAKDNAIDCKNKWRSSWKWKLWKNHHSSIEIIQYNLDGKKIKIWGNAREVTRELWIPYQNIFKVCKWLRNMAWGFIWKYNQ